jgi:hypothetical protein
MSQLLTPAIPDYELIDSGDFEKLERFGRYITRRPEPQAIWHRSLSEEEWRRVADASFLKTSSAKNDERGEWQCKAQMPDRWSVEYSYKQMHLKMRLALTSFKHVGIFPEQAANWTFIYDNIKRRPLRAVLCFVGAGLQTPLTSYPAALGQVVADNLSQLVPRHARDKVCSRLVVVLLAKPAVNSQRKGAKRFSRLCITQLRVTGQAAYKCYVIHVSFLSFVFSPYNLAIFLSIATD